MAISQPRKFIVNRETAEDMAVAALGFLAGDDERLQRFLSLSGLDPSHLRAAAAEPGFLPGVLAHIASDESLLLQFAAQAGQRPEDVASACALLAGPQDY